MRLDTSTDPQVGYRPPGTLEIETALARYDGAFGRRQAAHLARRAGFGASATETESLSSRDAQDAVDVFLHPQVAEIAFEPPDPTALADQHARTQTARRWWLDRMLRTRRPLAEKMTLFWHGHFATSARKVPAALMVDQIDLFRDRGLGNFRSPLFAVSTDHGTAMPLFVVGGSVKGGVYGAHPSLTDLDQNGDLKFGRDFRAVYATVVEPWLGHDPSGIVAGAYEEVAFV